MITFEQFSDYIETIQDEMKREDKINDVLSNEFALERTMLYNPLLSEYIKLLRDIFKDEGDYIGYYVYDLDFGRDYHEGDIQDENGRNIPLLTVEDLYNLLVENMDNTARSK